VVGEKKCPIVDTWWQTETGGILITPLPGATDLKPGSATLPRSSACSRSWSTMTGDVLEGNDRGQSVHHRFLAGTDAHGLWRPRALHSDLFLHLQGKYFTGDGCRRDEDGYYWITGRVDDVINVSGHRMGTAEVESALVAHPRFRRPRSSAIRTMSRVRASIATSR
jgi:acetyl-CoA synthetase